MKQYDSYKDSGIYFLPKLPSNWEIRKGKYLFKEENRPVRSDDEIVTCFRDGQVTLRKNRRTEGFTNSLKEIGYQGVRKGDLVIHNMDAFAGAIGVSDSDGKATPVYACCTPKSEEVSQYYYCYLLRYLARNGFILSLAKGIRERSTDFRFNDFKELYLPVPTRKEQDAIVTYLDAATSKIDEAIAQQQKMIDLLNERKQIIINNAVTKGLDPNVKMKPSGIDWIGDIPEHWKVMKTLFALSMPITDGPHETPQLYDDGIPFVSAEAVSCGNGRIDFDHIRGFISKAYYEECCKKYIPRRNDIYMIKSGATTGKVALVDTEQIFTIWSPLAVFRCNDKVMYFKYMFYLLQSDLYQTQVQLGWSYGTQQNIGMRTLEKLIIPVPSLEEQIQIANYLDSSVGKIENVRSNIERKISFLQERKQIIINDVVTGKVKVV